MVTCASLPSSSAHSWPRATRCGGSSAAIPSAPNSSVATLDQLVPPVVVDQQEVEPVADPQPIQAGPQQLAKQVGVGGRIGVEHAAAVGMGQRADTVGCRAHRQLTRRGAAAANDHERDQAGFGDERGGPGTVCGADQLYRVRVQPRTGQRGRDDAVDQRLGGSQRGAPGTQDPDIAGLDQLRGNVDRDIGARLVVGPDDPDGRRRSSTTAPLPRSRRMTTTGTNGRRGERVDLCGHPGDPAGVQTQTVAHRVREGGIERGDVGAVGVEQRLHLGPQARAHSLQGRGQRRLRRSCQAGCGGARGAARGLDEFGDGRVAHGCGSSQFVAPFARGGAIESDHRAVSWAIGPDRARSPCGSHHEPQASTRPYPRR